MKINGNEIRPGNIIEHNAGLWIAVKTSHVKPGKGGAFAQVELKNLRNGSKLNERFRSADKVEKVRLEQKDQQFLYENDGMLVFMDTETYEQIELPSDLLRSDLSKKSMIELHSSWSNCKIGTSFNDPIPSKLLPTVDAYQLPWDIMFLDGASTVCCGFTYMAC